LSAHPISRRRFLSQTLAAIVALPATKFFQPLSRRRLRELGIIIGSLPTGKWNAITDVPGVKVGHCTRIEGNGDLVVGRGPVRTGVTVVLPNEDIYHENLTAGRFVMNGNGEMTGMGSVDQRGLLQSPIFLTDTSNIGRVMNGAMSWFLQTYPEIGDAAPVPVPMVAETFADFLHDSAGRHLNDAHVLAAINSATSGAIQEGAVGGGTGMVCYDFKGGIGTASRVLPESQGGYTIGVLVQTNHGGRAQLMIDGVPVGREIQDLKCIEGKKSKSIILIGATNAPMIPAQLQRLCKRMAFGLARTGALSVRNRKLFIGSFASGNWNEWTGLHVAQDFGTFSSPIVLCNSTTVGIAYDALISFGYERDEGLPIDNAWPPIVIGLDDGYLNDLRQRRVTHGDGLRTIKQANDSAVVCGSAGIGRGLCALGAKGGVGDSSRLIKIAAKEYTLGVLMAANGGVRKPAENTPQAVSILPSLIVIMATDFPMLPEQLRQLAEAALRGLDGVVDWHDGTQQLALAFSTSNTIDGAFERRFQLFKERLPNSELLNQISNSAGECSRAALRRALEQAETVVGRKGRSVAPLPAEELERLFAK